MSSGRLIEFGQSLYVGIALIGINLKLFALLIKSDVLNKFINSLQLHINESKYKLILKILSNK